MLRQLALIGAQAGDDLDRPRPLEYAAVRPWDADGRKIPRGACWERQTTFLRLKTGGIGDRCHLDGGLGSV